MANYIISSGEICTGITLNSGDRMEIQSGGIAENTIVSSGGSLLIWNGGSASGVTTAKYGRITVSSGGRMEDAYLFGGTIEWMVTIAAGGVLSSAVVINGTNLCVYGSVYDIELRDPNNESPGDLSDLFMYDGAYAENVTVFSGGYLCMNSNTTVNGLTIADSRGSFNIPNGAKIENFRGTPFTANNSIPSSAIVSYDAGESPLVYYGSGTRIYS